MLWRSTPFETLQRFSDEVDRMWDDFGFGRRAGSSWRNPRMGMGAWDPPIEVSHKDEQLTIKADLPGLKRDEVTVDVADHAVTIQGERKREHEEEREGVYRSERSYGSFCRVVPLPESAQGEKAKASFRDGVLEITIPTPSSGKSRRLAIGDGTDKPTDPGA
jgi:HSP20 family protein